MEDSLEEQKKVLISSGNSIIDPNKEKTISSKSIEKEDEKQNKKFCDCSNNEDLDENMNINEMEEEKEEDNDD